MFLLNIFLPLIGSALSGFFGNYLGKKGATILTTSLMFICFLLSILNFIYIFSVEQFIYINLGTWISCDMFLVNWAFQLDYLSTIMFCVVTSVSFLVHLFSCSYMSKDPHVPRFMSYLYFFTFFIVYSSW